MDCVYFFQQRYSRNPLSLLRIIRHCLNTELKLVQQVENVSKPTVNRERFVKLISSEKHLKVAFPAAVTDEESCF
jgi:hypothetical protein